MSNRGNDHANTSAAAPNETVGDLISAALEKVLRDLWSEKHGPYTSPEKYPVEFEEFCRQRLGRILKGNPDER